MLYIRYILVTVLVLQFWFSSNRNPWLSSLNAGRLSIAEHLNCEDSLWILALNLQSLPCSLLSMNFDLWLSWSFFISTCFVSFLKKNLLPLWAPSCCILTHTDTDSVTVIILSVPYRCEVLESFVTSELGSSAVWCVCLCLCVWSLGVKKPQFLCLQVFRSAMCSFRQRVEQLVSHAYREFILISGVYLVFSCSQNVICLSGNYHFQKNKQKKLKKKWKTKKQSIQILYSILYSILFLFMSL